MNLELWIGLIGMGFIGFGLGLCAGCLIALGAIRAAQDAHTKDDVGMLW